MKQIGNYLNEKLHLDKDINIITKDIEVEYVSYKNGEECHDKADKMLIHDYEHFINELKKDEKFKDKLKNIKKVIIKYWYETNGAVYAVVKYEITFITNDNNKFGDTATWEAAGGRYYLVEGPNELGNKPDEQELIKHILLDK